jgi:ribokinase
MVVLNPAPVNSDVRALCGLVDVLVPNEVEAQQLTGIACDRREGAVSAARALQSEFGTRAVVLTLGDRGCLFVTDDDAVAFGPHEVRAVDTVGAGDAFAGALAAGLARGLELDDAVRYANAAGALAVTVPGAEPSMPRRDDVLALLDGSRADARRGS